MSEHKAEQQASSKRPYRAPTLRVIELATEEVLGVGCKAQGQLGQGAVCGQSPCGNVTGS